MMICVESPSVCEIGWLRMQAMRTTRPFLATRSGKYDGSPMTNLALAISEPDLTPANLPPSMMISSIGWPSI